MNAPHHDTDHISGFLLALNTILTTKSWNNFWSLASVHSLHIITLRTAEYFPTLSPGNTTLLIFGSPDFCNSFCEGHFIYTRSVISLLGLFEYKIYFLFSTHGHNRLLFSRELHTTSVCGQK